MRIPGAIALALRRTVARRAGCQLARKAWLAHQPHGRGHVVAFAEDPNLRALVDGTDLLFMNAMLPGLAF